MSIGQVLFQGIITGVFGVLVFAWGYWKGKQDGIVLGFLKGINTKAALEEDKQ